MYSPHIASTSIRSFLLNAMNDAPVLSIICAALEGSSAINKDTIISLAA